MEILGTTVREEDRQEIESLSWKTIDVAQPDYELEHVTAMIMQHANVAFLPNVSSFCNTGARLNGFVVNNSATLHFVLDWLDHEVHQLPQDNIAGPDFAEWKPVLYLIMKNVGFREHNIDWIDNMHKDGDGMSVPPTLPRHPLASGR